MTRLAQVLEGQPQSAQPRPSASEVLAALSVTLLSGTCVSQEDRVHDYARVLESELAFLGDADVMKQVRQCFRQLVHTRADGDPRQLDYLVMLETLFDRVELALAERQEQRVRSLQQSYVELEQVFQAAGDGLVGVAADFTITRANVVMAGLIGLEPDQVIGGKCYELYPNNDCDTPRCPMVRLAEGADVVEREIRLKCNGSSRWFIATAAPVRDESGNLLGMVESLKDITDRKKVEEELRNYRVLMQKAHDIMLYVDMDGRILDANEAALKAYGYTRKEFLKLTIGDLRLADTEDVYLPQMRQAYERGIVFETVHRRKDGSTFPVEVSSRRVTLEGADALLSIVRDVTTRKLAEQEIRYLSFHDRLTTLYNRTYFEDQLHRAQDEGTVCSIVMGDLNGLKLANDAFGHAAGDALLVETAQILKSSCRSDDVVARIGGDEFGLILFGADEATALSVVRRIRNRCARSKLQPLKPSIALGVATKSSPEENIFEVFQKAESRMYRRKLLEGSSIRSHFMHSLQQSLQEKSWETEKHTMRLRAIVTRLAKALDLSRAVIDDLALLAALHDIGKIAIPDDILNKPGPLTEEEWTIMKRHPEIGYRIARTSPELVSIAEYILSHHERWDGKGYPRGLVGENIPLPARLLSVADAFDAMTSDRPYRKAMSAQQALAELERNAGTQFDPDVVAAFVEMFHSGLEQELKGDAIAASP